MTGVSWFSAELGQKHIEVLHELLPKGELIALLLNPNNPEGAFYEQSAQNGARALGRRLLVLKAGTAPEIDAAFATLAERGANAVAIGVLHTLAADDAEAEVRQAAFLLGLQELGWTVGRNIRIETRWAAIGADRIRRSAAELVALAPDVILTNGASTLASLLEATRTVPIVFVVVVDPVGSGFVASLAQPGGNATGFTQYEFSISTKWLELLTQIAPSVKRAAILRDPTISVTVAMFAAIQGVAPSLGVELTPIDVRDTGELERAIAAFARGPNDGLIVLAGPTANAHRDLIAATSGSPPIARRLPLPLLRHRRWPDRLWPRFDRAVPAGALHRPHPQGREAGRPAGAGPDQVRANHQPQDRQSAWHRPAADAARARRRGDRVTEFFRAHCCTCSGLKVALFCRASRVNQ